jgi:hypothetical protein
MNDLTILYYTANKEPQNFMRRIQEKLLETVGDTPIVSVSQKPIDFGKNLCVGNIGMNLYNLYMQVLIAVREAHTPYVAIAEDDMVYSREHFLYRPPTDTIAYDVNKWALFTWKHYVFSKRVGRRVMSMCTAPRELLLNTLEERYTKYPTVESIPERIYKYYWGEPGRFEKHAMLTKIKTEMYEASVPSVAFFTPEALGFQYLGIRKALGPIQTDVLEPYGSAKEMYEYYYNW